MTVLIAVPMLGRPHRVRPLLDSVKANTPEPHTVLFLTTQDDSASRAVAEAGEAQMVFGPNPCGDYATKINTAATSDGWDHIFTGADDLKFHPGWLTAALGKMTDGVGVVGTQDLCNPRTMAGIHATHFLVARWYVELGTIDEPGKVFYDGYPHEFVDDEMVATAKHRGMYAFAPKSVVEHLHPLAGKAPVDDMYAQAPLRIRRGRQLFRRREHLWT